MRDPRPGPASSFGERQWEARLFGGYLFFAVACSAFTFMTGSILIFRGSIHFDGDLMTIGCVSGGILAMVFAYFGALRKHMIVIPILK